MKKIRAYWTAVCCMAMLVGCQQAEEIESKSEELRMKVEACIGKTVAVAGRYAGSAPNEVEFTTGDEIGLSVNGEAFVKWTTADGSNWTQEGDAIHWDNKTDSHDFCAFYPYVASATLSSVPMPDLTIQEGKMNELGNYDFLTASMDATYGDDGVVALNFSHELALVTIKLKDEGDLVSSTINKITIAGDDILTPSTYSFSEPDVSLASDEAEGVHSLAVDLDEAFPSGGKTFYFVVNPKTVALSGVSLTIEYLDKNEISHIATLEALGDSSAEFENGKEYSYSLKVQSGVLVVSGNKINDWKVGINNPDDIVINGTPKE